jgi:Subtilase family
MRFLLDFKNGTSQQDINTYLSTNGCTVVQEWDNFDKVYLVETNNTPPADSILERITEEVPLKIKPLTAVEINPYFQCHEDPNKPKITISTSDDKDWWKNYSYMTPRFELPEYEISRLGQNITIYLMDSGILKTHTEFSEANIIDLYTVTPGDFSDNSGHGTALASVMVGKTCGITAATLKNVKIFNPNHNTLQSEFLTALDSIINDHVDGQFSICNCSWIIEKNEWVEHKLQILNNEGVFIIAAAGNQGTSIEDVTPASMFEALTVGAYNKNLVPCDFSNYTGGSAISVTENQVNHGELDGWAPGEEIWAATLDGGYAYTAGTSMATAIVSACTAANLSWFVHDNGEAFTHYKENTTIDSQANGFQYVFSFIKKQLLDFSQDIKYENSKNIITGLFDKCSNLNIQLPDEINCKINVGNTNITVLGAAFNPNQTKGYEWIVELPNNFELLKDGLIVGKPNFDQGPEVGQNYKKFEASLKRINIDNSEEIVVINLYICKDNINPNELPSDDPVIPILLQNSCAPNAWICVLQTVFACTYACSGGQNCCSINCSKYTYACECVSSCP